MRKAKIIATIGPASSSPEKLRALIEAGMNVARLNFSHGDYSTHRETIREVRRLSREMGRPVAIMQDLQGIKIRTGPLEGRGPVLLETGSTFSITREPVRGTKEEVSTSYSNLPRDVRAGDRILLSDGLIELKVLATTDTTVRTEVVVGGMLAEHQGINLPGVRISAPPLTEKDIEDLEFGLEQEVDYVALSFVRQAEDVQALRRQIERRGREIPIIAKLERPLAIENLDAILESSEGVMVARGDLGVEMPPERVPVVQKQIIERANQEGRIVITATQMLDSMIRNPRPTRAEASDVANAVFDGSDALMLSGETARGKYPVRAVRMMSKIIREAERHARQAPGRPRQEESDLSFPQAVCDAAYHASLSINARAIIAFTQTGRTTALVSKYRPTSDIISFTPHPRVVRRMALYWGVRAYQMNEIGNVDELIRELERLLLEMQLVRPGDNLIILTGAPIVERGHTSLMKLHSVKEHT